MDQATAASVIKGLLERKYTAIVNWLEDSLLVPSDFLIEAPGGSVHIVVNNQRLGVVEYFSDPVTIGKGYGYGAIVGDTNFESACFIPYAHKGPRLSICTGTLKKDAENVGIPVEALLEILAMHEMVHVAMMAWRSCLERDDEHPWLANPEYTYIHEATALKFCEFGLPGMVDVATPEHISQYLDYVKEVSKDRESGMRYLPYFDSYTGCPLNEFWDKLRASQPAPGIFELVEEDAA